MNKKCRECGVTLNENNKYPNQGNICKPCKREYIRKYALKRKERVPEYLRWHRRQSAAKLKLETFQHYSSECPQCAKCGYSDIRALSIDHVNGGGSQHRRDLGFANSGGGGGGEKFYRWLKKNEYPQGYQVLCLNCQFIKMHENNEIKKFPQDDSQQP